MAGQGSAGIGEAQIRRVLIFWLCSVKKCLFVYNLSPLEAPVSHFPSPQMATCPWRGPLAHRSFPGFPDPTPGNAAATSPARPCQAWKQKAEGCEINLETDTSSSNIFWSFFRLHLRGKWFLWDLITCWGGSGKASRGNSVYKCRHFSCFVKSFFKHSENFSHNFYMER